MNHKKFLEALRPNQQVLFISDPTKGDQFVTGTAIRLFKIPETAESHEINTAQHFLDTLDFEVYETR